MKTKKQSDTILHIYLLITDLAGSFIGAVIAFAIRYGTFLGINESGDAVRIIIILLIITAIINVFASPVKRFITRGSFKELIDVAIRQLISIGVLVMLLYLAHSADTLSRLVFAYYMIAGIVIVWLLRIVIKNRLKKHYKTVSSAIKIIILADKDRMGCILERFNQSGEWKRVIVKTVINGESACREVIDYAAHHEVDEVFISIINNLNEAPYREFVSELIGMGIKTDIDIMQFEMKTPGKKYLDEIGKYAVVAIERNVPSISRMFLKRLGDIIGGLAGVVIFAIAFVIVGPLIKLDSEGPVIFVQKRVGKNGRIFDFYKFRSMYVDAEERKKELMDQNEMNGLMFKMENDPRITKIGKFLRKTSIDELPQFICVLKGDMSLVGTRPPTVDEYNKYKSYQKSRLSMKPGITGLWQISGRSDIKDFDEVIKLDMQYIDNWSIIEDIRIFLKTGGVVLTGKGSR